MSFAYDGPVFFDSGITYDAVMLQHTTPMNARVALNTVKLTDSSFVSKVQVGIDGLTTNAATFTTPNPTLVIAQGKLDDLSANLSAILNAAQALEQLRQTREQLRLEVEAVYAQLGAYVENIAAGDPAKILLAGFDVVQPPGVSEPKSLGPVMGNVLVSGPDEAHASGTWSEAIGARSYEVQITGDVQAGPWVHYETVTEPRVLLTDQPSGQKRWTRVRAVGPKSARGPWSDPACAMIP